jgi:hypothetical protein
MKNTKKILSVISALVIAGILTACGGSGSGSNTVIEGMTGPDVEMVNGKVMLTMVFKDVFIDGGVTIPIPKYPQSTLQVGPDFASNGTLVSLVINAADYLGNQGSGLDPQTLPGGRPLPGVAAGSMPAVALNVPQLWNSVLYVGPEVIGFFVPFQKLNMAGAIVSFRFYDKSNKAVGLVSLVGADANGQNAGVLAMMNSGLLGIKSMSMMEKYKLYKKYSYLK